MSEYDILLCKMSDILHFIFCKYKFLVYILTYISKSFCTTCLILLDIIIIICLSVNTYVHYL